MLRPGSFAERKRRLVRDELCHLALRLIAAQGYKETTVEQIVDAAGVSRRTFFRYFKSKEDVIIEVLGDVEQFVVAELTARPPGEPAAEAVREVLRALARLHAGEPDKTLAITRLILETPDLRARYLSRTYEWRRSMAAVLARRDGREGSSLRDEVTVAVPFAALEAALTRWDGRTDLASDFDRALEMIS
ncbi:TetR family transcriptional regulator [Streptosporangiaceae bacterium NEAU-GS5]|nr:TetR family transcriptional regulator [Streptosporangiaceae bacterium NEAU-GS5]